MKLLTISASIQLKSSTLRPASSGWRATCSASAFSFFLFTVASSSMSSMMADRYFRCGGTSLAPRGDSGRDELGYVVHGGTHQPLGKYCESLPSEARVRRDAGNPVRSLGGRSRSCARSSFWANQASGLNGDPPQREAIRDSSPGAFFTSRNGSSVSSSAPNTLPVFGLTMWTCLQARQVTAS
jgi:hypothetical protein